MFESTNLSNFEKNKEDLVFFSVLIIFASLTILFAKAIPYIASTLSHPNFHFEGKATAQTLNKK